MHLLERLASLGIIGTQSGPPEIPQAAQSTMVSGFLRGVLNYAPERPEPLGGWFASGGEAKTQTNYFLF